MKVASGWPLMTGLIAAILGMLMLGGAALFQAQSRELAELTASIATPRSDRPSTPTATVGTVVPAPLLVTHLDDMNWLFKLTKDQGIGLGSIEYRSQANSSLPLVMRTLDLRLEEDYPKLKALVSELLRKFPHLFLDEIRVEQGSTPPKVKATLKLSFVYQAPSGKGQPK